ncbi:MAG: hypothetical protein DHS20C16_35970 [Phycisphaerae bacterium]|nr:MAG: hypothetical protein DHS20C16_35970 [Phycisphaerae bacterium]
MHCSNELADHDLAFYEYSLQMEILEVRFSVVSVSSAAKDHATLKADAVADTFE